MAKDLTKIRHKPPFRWLGQVLKKASRHYLLGLLCLIILVLCYLNYQPGTFLTGWDNLHPEYNLPANLGRAIFSVWEEYQSLGLLAGMAHAADLPRELFLLLISQFHPDLSLYRYLWTFLMLFLGPVGTYVLLYRSFLRRHFDHQTNHFASFLGGLFYLLNLGTLQQFFTPFETFVAFYGFLPWLIYALLTYLEHPKAGNLFWLFLVSFLATPSFVTETLLVVFGFCLICFFAGHYHKRNRLIHLFLSASVIAVANSFWLLPNLFFVLTNGSVGVSAKMNLISTPETYFRNLEFGNLSNLALIKGFWFNFLDLATGNKFDYLMTPWRTHTDNPTIYLIGYLSFALVATGIVYSIKKRLPYAKSFLGILAVCYFFLLGGGLLVNNTLPIVGELFRSPFTKFSAPLALTYAVFFSVGCIFLLDLFSFLHSRLTYVLTLFTVGLALVIFMTPAFTGYLISPTMRLKVPPEYFELFDYFKSVDPATRIANFPQHTFLGWNYYDWGYRGSGFLWYGIKQPILDRAFDVWEKNSERYYEEISTALYSENQKNFESLIDKYAINWILIDKHVIAASPNEDLGNEKLQRLLDNSKKFTLVKNLNDKLLIYQTDLDQRTKNFLSLSGGSPTQNPFADLSLRPLDPGSTDGQITLKTTTQNSVDAKLILPSISTTESLIPIKVTYKKTASGLELKLTPILPEITLRDQKIDLNAQASLVDFNLTPSQSGLIIGINDQYYEVQLPDELAVQTTFYPLTNIYLPPKKNINLTLFSNTPSYKLDLTSAFNQAQPYQCYTNKPNRKIEKIIDRQTISLFGTDMVGCLSVPLPAGSLNQLLSLEFTYNSHTSTPANANITDTSLGSLGSPQPLLAKTEPTFTRNFARPRPVPLQANLILEANEVKSTQEIIYQNVQVSYLPQLGEVNLSLNLIPAITVPAPPSTPLTISLPIVESSLTTRSAPDSNHFLPSAINCDNFNTGKFDRLVTPNGFLYESQNANSCDQINLKHLPHDVNYAVIADIQNQTGLFPTICLENYSTRRCDVFERLVNGKQFILQPINNTNEPPGYTLHLFNQSFGNRKTVNQVKSITTTPFPVNFVKSISISPAGSEPSQQVLTDSTHPAEFLYLVKTDNRQPQSLNLYQTKSRYWKALEISETDLKLPTWLLVAKIPHLYFFGPKANLLIQNESGWYNSWNLPIGKHNLVIFYLPQYLEFIGFLPLPLTLISLVLLVFKQKSPR